MKILSYNIWNYLPTIKERTHKLIEHIKLHRYDVLALQEVTKQSLQILKEALKSNYIFYHHSSCWYFNCILVNINLPSHRSFVVDFQNTNMHRHFITLKLPQFVLITSHLESSKPFKDVRQKQIKELAEYVNKYYKNTQVIFCGDTNLFTNESDKITGFNEIRGNGYTYTFNPLKNPLCETAEQLLLDRVYLKGDLDVEVDIVESNTISDHYGIIIDVKDI